MLETCDTTTQADRANGRRIVLWSLAWAGAVLFASALLSSDQIQGAGAWLMAIGCTVIGIGGLAAFRRYVQEADELTRRIQLEGISFGFGVGLLVALSSQLFEFAGAPALGASMAGTVMIFGYIGGVVMATQRHR